MPFLPLFLPLPCLRIHFSFLPLSLTSLTLKTAFQGLFLFCILQMREIKDEQPLESYSLLWASWDLSPGRTGPWDSNFLFPSSSQEFGTQGWQKASWLCSRCPSTVKCVFEKRKEDWSTILMLIAGEIRFAPDAWEPSKPSKRVL